MKILATLFAFGGYIISTHAQHHGGIRSPTSNIVPNQSHINKEGIVETVTDKNNKARKLKVHDVFFAKIKNELDSNSHLSSSAGDELDLVFNALKLSFEIIISDIDSETKLSALVYVAVGYLGLLEIITEDEALDILNDFNESKGDDDRMLMNDEDDIMKVQYDNGDEGRHLQTIDPPSDPDSLFLALIFVADLLSQGLSDEAIATELAASTFTARVSVIVGESILGEQTFTCPTVITDGSVAEGGNCCANEDCIGGQSCITNVAVCAISGGDLPNDCSAANECGTSVCVGAGESCNFVATLSCATPDTPGICGTLGI